MDVVDPEEEPTRLNGPTPCRQPGREGFQASLPDGRGARVRCGRPPGIAPGVAGPELQADVHGVEPQVRRQEGSQVLRARRMVEREFLERGSRVNVGWDAEDVRIIEG